MKRFLFSVILCSSLPFTATAQQTVNGPLTIRANSAADKPLVQLQNPFSVMLSAWHSDEQTNLYLGVEAGQNNVLGSGELGRYQTYIGLQSGRGTGALNFRNTGIGPLTLRDINQGNQNVAIGPFAGMRLYDATKNIFIGVESGSNGTNLHNNVGVGVSTLRFATTGSANVAVGMNAMMNANGTANTAVGQSALSNNANGNWNSVVGNGAFGNLLDGNENSSLGWIASSEWLHGSNNLFLGSQTGRFATDGSGNVFIGDRVYGTNGNNQLNVSNLIFSNNADGKGLAISTGGVGIGVREPEERLDVDGNAKVRGELKVCDSHGCVSLSAEQIREILQLIAAPPPCGVETPCK